METPKLVPPVHCSGEEPAGRELFRVGTQQGIHDSGELITTGLG